jgi:cytosine/adenosine deaminase-related metal-dependent hydrolase
MGWDDRVGALAPGRYADLVAVPGDPFAALDGSGLAAFLSPELVMKGGAVVRDDRGGRAVPLDGPRDRAGDGPVVNPSRPG